MIQLQKTESIESNTLPCSMRYAASCGITLSVHSVIRKIRTRYVTGNQYRENRSGVTPIGHARASRSQEEASITAALTSQLGGTTERYRELSTWPIQIETWTAGLINSQTGRNDFRLVWSILSDQVWLGGFEQEQAWVTWVNFVVDLGLSGA
ncbi:hypothetical protein RRG08_055543 [Elysia crispata]|uniref:Uncharacterized protein n=1 Tax=Elysia crispata TaxID=231223 RepID=A0AAE1AFH0_9GAST|nr:hypothetical protein RRG08_055543 [Elysia crispata]